MAIGIRRVPETARRTVERSSQGNPTLNQIPGEIGCRRWQTWSPKKDPNPLQGRALMKTTSGIEWIYSRKTRACEIVKVKGIEDISVTPCTLPSNKAGSGGQGLSRGREGRGGRGNINWVGNSDEPLLPLFPNGNETYDSSGMFECSNNSRRGWGLGGLLPLPLEGSTL